MDKADIFLGYFCDNSGMAHLVFSFSSSKKEKVSWLHLVQLDFSPNFALVCRHSGKVDTHRIKGVEDQSGAIHATFCRPAILVRGAIIRLGGLDYCKSRGVLRNFLFGFTTLKKQAAQH